MNRSPLQAGLVFVQGKAWFVADTHAKNLVSDQTGQLRVIDLLTAPFPVDLAEADPLMRDWLQHVAANPAAGLLCETNDDEL